VKLIGLTGLPRSGKDTFASFLVERHGYTRLAFADPLKQAAAHLLGRTVDEMHGCNGFDREAILPEWGFSTRWFLQVLGTECMRQQVREDFWIQHMRNRIERTYGNIVITDCRFPNEAALVHEYGGIVVKIERDGAIRSDHVSDRGIDADLTVLNNGTLEGLATAAAAVRIYA